ncbi:MAG: right-handed parallel beta-helix repeat-containing protein [Phycisphaerales bacterium]|nr:right-handed parallel beta-helix repeat-containing protein [Phycisphaerales bacterium]
MIDSRMAAAIRVAVIVCCAWAVVPSSGQTILYVDRDATSGLNNGTSWSDAFVSLQDALSETDQNTAIREIWVADGVYTPDDGFGFTPGDRTVSFELRNNVALYGGFSGIEIARDQRDINTNATVLSGDLSENDIVDLEDGIVCMSTTGVQLDVACQPYDVDLNSVIDCSDLRTCENSFSIVTAPGGDNSSVLDGFTLKGGQADGPSELSQNGGAAFKLGSPTLRNNTFVANYGRQRGGAVRIGTSTAVITDCIFRANVSADTGAGINILAGGGSPYVARCRFEGNVAQNGAGIFCRSSNLIIEDCDFEENRARYGAGLWVEKELPSISRCRFIRNTPITGAGCSGGSTGLRILNTDVEVTDCEFIENVGVCTGAVQVVDASPTFRSCRFEGNLVGNSGAAISDGTAECNIQIQDCDFVENGSQADCFGTGGALYFQSAGPKYIQNSRFIRNTACDQGGAIRLHGINDGFVSIANCLFAGNRCNQRRGGALYIDGGAGSICVNSDFVGNTAGLGGGASIGFIDFSACTFAFNESDSTGAGAIAIGDSVPHAISNCIFWENRASGLLNHVSVTTSGLVSVDYSLIQDDDPNDAIIPFGGLANGNIDDDPLFVRMPDAGTNGWGDADDDYGNLRLLPGSPAIDAGSNGLIRADETDLDCDENYLEQTPFDLSGLPRIVDDPATVDTGTGGFAIVDMGAHEFGTFVGSRLFVDVDAMGLNDGSSWTDAFTALQDALNGAAANGCGAQEIWVAEGSYYPDLGSNQIFGDRSSTFQLLDGVAIYGGFNGSETARIQRDVSLHETILSGDLGVADDPSDDVYHVVSGTGTSALAILDGFSIERGNADQPASGGGLITIAGGPTLRNCTLIDNSGDCASGLVSYGGFLTIENLTLGQNSGGGAGVGISQTEVTLEGDWNIQTGEVEAFESVIKGGGQLDLDHDSTLRIKREAPCGAEVITTVSGFISTTDIFAPQTNGTDPLPARWEIIDAPISDFIIAGSQTNWFIAPSTESGTATLSWTGQFIGSDLSAGGLASASFVGEGVLTITGAVYDGPGPGANLLFDGELLVASVEPFGVEETSTTSDQLEFAANPKLKPLGGFLTNNNDDFLLTGSQSISALMSLSEQNGGELVDFDLNSVIAWSGVSQLTFGPIAPPQGESTVLADIRGTGDIEIEPGARLVVGGSATLNLSGLADDVCSLEDSPGAPLGGAVNVLGSLVVQDAARIQNTNVAVSLLDLQGVNDIVHNDIRLVESAPGFGGEFFASGQSVVSCNSIVSEGDRYLDLDPDPTDGAQPSIVNNRVTVIIKEGTAGDQGTLLELRSIDYDCTSNGANPTCASGAFSAAGSPGFTVDPSENWVIDRLEVTTGAKVNLTNRAGFEFTSNGIAEAAYVKNLVMYPEATLNTALQALYYESLIYVDSNGSPVSSNGAEIVDIPLLGFSLGVIRMDDPTEAPFNEFDVRVRKRVRDTNDQQLPPPALPKQGAITLLPGELGGNNGVMEMTTLATGDFDAATSVAAKGAFARAGEEDVTVAFEYSFQEDSNSDAEIIVYVSKNPRVSEDLVELARIKPPQSGRPGAVGSTEFGVFHGTFASGQTNFRRGTYVELVLRGEGARVWIDNWDPRVECIACSDLNGTTTVDTGDLLVLLAEMGKVADLESNSWCLDSLQNRDQYVDLSDVLAMEVFINDDSLNACGTGTDGVGRGAANDREVRFVQPTPNSILIAGKPSISGDQGDVLYTIGTNGFCAAPSQVPASNPGLNGYRGNGRIIARKLNEFFQLHMRDGLVRLGDGAAVIAPSSAAFGSSTVYVGISDVGGGNFQGLPILDAAFDPSDERIVYVTPVLVSTSSGHVYKATAQLQLSEPSDGSFTVTELFGRNPHTDSSITVSTNDWGDVVFEPDLQRMRELEVDAHGNLFVVSALAAGDANDWISVYETSVGNASEQRFSVSSVLRSPTALFVSHETDFLYVSSSISETATGNTRLHRFQLERTNDAVTDLIVDGTIDIVNPTASDQSCGATLCGQSAAITSIMENPHTGHLYVSGFTTPLFPENADPQSAPFSGTTGSLLATPTLAVIDAPQSATGTFASIAIDCDGLSLPIAATFVAEPEPGDCDSDGDIDLDDYATCFETCLLGPNAGAVGGCADVDFDLDGDIDLADFATFGALLAN